MFLYFGKSGNRGHLENYVLIFSRGSAEPLRRLRAPRRRVFWVIFSSASLFLIFVT